MLKYPWLIYLLMNVEIISSSLKSIIFVEFKHMHVQNWNQKQSLIFFLIYFNRYSIDTQYFPYICKRSLKYVQRDKQQLEREVISAYFIKSITCAMNADIDAASGIPFGTEPLVFFGADLEDLSVVTLISAYLVISCQFL